MLERSCLCHRSIQGVRETRRLLSRILTIPRNHLEIHVLVTCFFEDAEDLFPNKEVRRRRSQAVQGGTSADKPRVSPRIRAAFILRFGAALLSHARPRAAPRWVAEPTRPSLPAPARPRPPPHNLLTFCREGYGPGRGGQVPGRGGRARAPHIQFQVQP